MALVTLIQSVTKANPKVHRETKCECSTFDVDGSVYVQLDTFGSDTRQERGQVSQSLQLNLRAARQLHDLLSAVLSKARR